MIRLLALDIDGTLLDSDGRIPDANREAIARAIDAGVEVALATGRRYDFARPIFESLPASAHADPQQRRHRQDSRRADRDAKSAAARGGAVGPDGTRHRASAAVVFDRPREGQVVFEAIDWDHPRHRAVFRSQSAFPERSPPLEECLTEDPSR